MTARQNQLIRRLSPGSPSGSGIRGILEAYEAVEKWVADNGLTIDDAPREVYFADWSEIGDDDPGV